MGLVKKYLFGINSDGKVYSENVEVSKINHNHDGKYVPYTNATDNLDLGEFDLLTEGMVKSSSLSFSETDPSTLENPPDGKHYYGSYLGRLWQLDSNGEIQWHINENDLIDLAFAQSIDAKFRELVLNELGNLYVNNGVSFIGKLKSLKLTNKIALLLTPAATKSGTLFSIIPFNSGKFTCQRASKATQVNEFGQLEIVENNTPRIDYSGTRIS